MGENIGDASGVAVGLEAYHLSLNGQAAPVIDGTTGDQRFFYGWAQVWQSKYRDEALKQQVATPTRTRPPSSASSARCATSTPGTTPSTSSPARNTI